jgi:hypothetical protein
MSSTRPVDAAWQLAFRLGLPLARVWWRLRGARRGALVAVYVDQALLIVLKEWNFPGGGINAARRRTQPRGASWQRRSVSSRRGCYLPVKKWENQADANTVCTSLNCD